MTFDLDSRSEDSDGRTVADGWAGAEMQKNTRDLTM